MIVQFDEAEKRLSISECDFQAVEIYKDNQLIADIPLVEGNGFIINTDMIKIDDAITLYPYNSVEVIIEKSVEV